MSPIENETPRRLRQLRRFIARGVVMGRWAMVPLFVGLLVALALLVITFFIQLWSFIVAIGSISDTESIMKLLTLIDLALIGGLIVIVVSSGYANFVGKLDNTSSEDWPVWMTRISFSGLKLKLFATLMAITAVAFLKALMRLEADVSEAQVRWLAVACVVFILAYATLALTDRFTHTDDDA
ncbi:MAG: YqhA family protein [Pseudochelatococcus sp.]|uniref:YqhA family protein n=1 Tax=Pseudochelatococcus sp. TaxID=2020869 RepID=UPI003D8A2A48